MGRLIYIGLVQSFSYKTKNSCSKTLSTKNKTHLCVARKSLFFECVKWFMLPLCGRRRKEHTFQLWFPPTIKVIFQLFHPSQR